MLDFGLAKAMSERSRLRTTRRPRRRSPMRATHGRRDPGHRGLHVAGAGARQGVDKRADIWAFGVVLYEMLTGRQLFDGPTVSDTLAAVLTNGAGLDGCPGARCGEADASAAWQGPEAAAARIGERRTGRGGRDPGGHAACADRPRSLPAAMRRACWRWLLALW